MGTRALRAGVAVLLVGLAAGTMLPVSAQPDPFLTMNALRVIPPTPVPDVTFLGLDGRPWRLESFRGRPVLLTFFTTW